MSSEILRACLHSLCASENFQYYPCVSENCYKIICNFYSKSQPLRISGEKTCIMPNNVYTVDYFMVSPNSRFQPWQPHSVKKLFDWCLIFLFSNQNSFQQCSLYCSHLGGVVVSVLATGLKGLGFKTRLRWRTFKEDKNLQHTFLRVGSKARGPKS
jgi:hypothetical protein